MNKPLLGERVLNFRQILMQIGANFSLNTPMKASGIHSDAVVSMVAQNRVGSFQSRSRWEQRFQVQTVWKRILVEMQKSVRTKGFLPLTVVCLWEFAYCRIQPWIQFSHLSKGIVAAGSQDSRRRLSLCSSEAPCEAWLHWDRVLGLPIIFKSPWERRNVSVNILEKTVLLFPLVLHGSSPHSAFCHSFWWWLPW